MAANTIQDFLKSPLGSVKEATITFITKLFVLIYGAVAILLAFFMAEFLTGPATQMTMAILSALGSPVMGIILMGASIPWANKYGALAGVAVSLCFNLWMGIGSVFHSQPPTPLAPLTTENCLVTNSTDFQVSSAVYTHQANLSASEVFSTTVSSSDMKIAGSRDVFFLYEISYEWYPVAGGLVCITTGLVVSFLTSLRSDGKAFCGFPSGSTEAKYIFPFLRRFWGLGDGVDYKFDDEIDDNENTKFDISKEDDVKNGQLNLEKIYPLLKNPRAF